MSDEILETPEQHIEAEASATAAIDSVESAPRRGRARLWLAALGFVLAAVIVVAGIQGPDVHAHRLQMAASARRLRSYQRVEPAADPAAKMPEKYSMKGDKSTGDSASKKAQRNRKSGGGGRRRQ